MLQLIRDALPEIIKNQDDHRNDGINVGINDGINDGMNDGINDGTNEDKVIALLRQDGRLTAKNLALTLRLTQQQAERILAALKKKGVLIRHGANKNGFWEVI